MSTHSHPTIAYQRIRLLARQRELLAELGRASNDPLQALAADREAEGFAEQAQRLELEEPNWTRVALEREELARVDAALARIEHGTFGRCASCGQLIPARRLAADPASALCLGCQAEHEAGSHGARSSI